MKSRITLLMAVAVILFAAPLFSQEAEMIEKASYPSLKKWEIGIFLGASNYQGDLIKPSFTLSGDNTNFGYGAHIRHNFNPNFAARINYFGTNLSGDETKFEDRGYDRSYNFETPLTEISAMLEWDLLGKRRYNSGAFKRTVSPYLLAGVGFSLFEPEVNFINTDNPAGEQADRASEETSSISVPLGGGLRFDLSEKIHLDLEGGFRTPFSDYLDGVSESADPEDNDWYSYLGLNIGYRLGAGKDTDGDGIPDKKDACPEVAGLAELDGCPDRDGDTITDKKDKCPDIAGPVEYKGCPDTDGDGIIDIDDKCPQVPGGVALDGCPDTDGDGVIDMEDDCPNTPGIQTLGGCPDSDGDGIVDKLDECPLEAGTSLNNGCPKKDADGDGIADADDNCPNVKGTAATGGCPDRDGDGVIDSKDNCPDEAGTSSTGCPIVTRTVVTRPACNCTGNENAIFNIPVNRSPKVLTKLGTNPEFGNSHGLDGTGFFNKLRSRYDNNPLDKQFLDNLFKAMGYFSFQDASPLMFSEVELPYGIVGNIGYSKAHKTLYAKINAKLNRDLQAFRIQSANGCDVHFMKTCGNHMFFCN